MTTTLTPRGMRNNNPLNIRHSASRWQGVRAEQTDTAFVQFVSMAMGYRAAWRTLETYHKRFEAKRLPFTPRNISTAGHHPRRTIRRRTFAPCVALRTWREMRPLCAQVVPTTARTGKNSSTCLPP